MRPTVSIAAVLVVALAASRPVTAFSPEPQGAGSLAPEQTAPGGTTPTPGAPPAPVPPQNVVAPPPPGRVFASEHGVVFNAIRPDKVMDFETVLAKLRQALAASTDATRSAQGRGWKVYKAAEPGPNGSVLYVFVMDPVVKGADYGVAKILAEAYPAEIAELYRMYSGAFAAAGQTLLNLQDLPATPGASPQTSAPAAPPAPAAR